MRILLDADILVALSKSDDSNHTRAVSLFRKQKQASLHISPFCIPECITVLSYKVSQKAAVLFLNDIRKRSVTEVPYENRTREQADKIFSAQSSKGISWFDCYNVAIMQGLSMDAIASFDKFYRNFDLKILK